MRLYIASVCFDTNNNGDEISSICIRTDNVRRGSLSITSQLNFEYLVRHNGTTIAYTTMCIIIITVKDVNLGGQGQGLVALGVLVWRCDVCTRAFVSPKMCDSLPAVLLFFLITRLPCSVEVCVLYKQQSTYCTTHMRTNFSCVMAIYVSMCQQAATYMIQYTGEQRAHPTRPLRVLCTQWRSPSTMYFFTELCTVKVPVPKPAGFLFTAG